MAEPVRYSDSVTIRCQPEITAMVDRAARAKGSKPSEYVRQALLAGLRADGFDPAAIPPRDAGMLYDSVNGQQRYALVTPAGDIQAMSYHDAKPEDDERGKWVPVVHEDSEPFDLATHWRLAPIVTIVDQYDGPNRVLVSYPVIRKSMEAM